MKKLLEGNVTLLAESLTAKMINGDAVFLAAAATAKLGAMYGQSLCVQAGSHVDVGLVNGHMLARSTGGDVALRGIDGSFVALADSGNLTLQINRLRPGRISRDVDALPIDGIMDGEPEKTAKRQLVEAVSNAIAAHGVDDLNGSIGVALSGQIASNADPELVSTLLCHTRGSAGRAKVTIVSDAFVPETEAIGYRRGQLSGKSASVKRPTFGSVGGSSSVDNRGTAASSGKPQA